MLNKIFYYIFFTIVAVVALFFVLIKFPQIGGFRSLIVLSGSMEPTIHIGSVAVIKKSDEYKIDDIITFAFQNASITHRIKDVKKEGEEVVSFVTKGDANKIVDYQVVLSDQIFGKVIFEDSLL